MHCLNCFRLAFYVEQPWDLVSFLPKCVCSRWWCCYSQKILSKSSDHIKIISTKFALPKLLQFSLLCGKSLSCASNLVSSCSKVGMLDVVTLFFTKNTIRKALGKPKSLAINLLCPTCFHASLSCDVGF